MSRCLKVLCVLGLHMVNGMSLAATTGFTEKEDWQAKCLESRDCMPEYFCEKFVGDGRGADGSWPVCLDTFRSGTCLVYSFGVADDWKFDQQMGAFGCEVHSFDPTVELPKELAPNVTFHPWGLKGEKDSGMITHGSEALYGRSVLGPIYTLREIRHRLGHHSHLSVLKMDCEGCEWGLFADLKANPTVLPDQIAVEFHFSEAFGITATKGMQDISNAFKVLSRGNYQRFFWHENPGEGPIIDELLDVGYPPNSCCREMVFLRSHKSTEGSLAKTIGSRLKNLQKGSN